VIETPSYDLTVFKVHFGLLTLKAYSKGEHVLRFEAIVHNTRQLRRGRVLERFPEIVSRLTAMLERFTIMLDRVDVAYLPGEILDELPRPSRLGATASAASTSTRSVRASCSPASSRSRPHRKASPSLSSLRRCTR